MKTKLQGIRERVFEIVSKAESGDRASRVFDWTIMALIALSVLAIILESFAGLYAKYRTVFMVFERITVTVFAIEYLLRIWTADLLYPEAKHPRLKYFFSPMALIDLLAILPFFLPFVSADLRFLRMIRLLRLTRLLRVFKLGRYLEAFQTILRVIRSAGPKLLMSSVICFFIMLLSAIVMYTAENSVQPEQFPNVISALWWAICTLTTVGYGDVYPVTDIGKLFASFISFFGIGIIAIPTGIIAAEFGRTVGQDGEEDAPTASAASAPAIEGLTEAELLALEAAVAARLTAFGYATTIAPASGGEKAEAPSAGPDDDLA
ncbi:MAG: ion transporter [Clostridia bacterium]|nr:ion transporter [Clostridia bacterium]